MEIPLEAAVKICNRRQQVYKLTCDRLHMLMLWCQAVTRHMLDGTERPKRAVAVVICRRRHTLTHTCTCGGMHTRSHLQENRETRTRTPDTTHLAAGIVQMAILPRVRQHPLACGANNRIHSALSP